MLNIQKKIQKRIKENNGASNTIEFVIILIAVFLVFSILIDYNAWSINRNIVQTAAQNGARLVSVYGGSDKTDIQTEYGVAKYPNCVNAGPECYVAEELKASSPVGSINIEKIECGPNKVRDLGERTWCSITYSWKGLSGSPLLLMDTFKTTTVRSSAASEVQFKN